MPLLVFLMSLPLLFFAGLLQPRLSSVPVDQGALLGGDSAEGRAAAAGRALNLRHQAALRWARAWTLANAGAALPSGDIPASSIASYLPADMPAEWSALWRSAVVGGALWTWTDGLPATLGGNGAWTVARQAMAALGPESPYGRPWRGASGIGVTGTDAGGVRVVSEPGRGAWASWTVPAQIPAGVPVRVTQPQ